MTMEVIIATLIIFLGAYIQTALGFGLAIVAAPILFLLDPPLRASAHNHVSTDIVARYGFKSLGVNIFLGFKICGFYRSYTWDNMWGDVVGLDFCWRQHMRSGWYLLLLSPVILESQ